MFEGFNFKSGKIFKENPERDLTNRAERLLQKLDFQVLEDIFKEEREKSGIRNEASTVEIKYDSGIKPLGQWNQHKERVTLNLKKLYEVFETDKEDPARSKGDTPTFESYVTSCLTHELTHAQGHNSCRSTPKSTLLRAVFNNIFNIIPDNKSGYRHFNTRESGEVTRKYSAFNEAVTDMIAEEVFIEYKKRTADEVVIGANFFRSYSLARERLVAFMTLVCKRVEASPENIWKAVKQGYFSGLDLNNTELGRIYDDLVTAGVNKDEISDHYSDRLDEVTDLLSRRWASEDFLERIRQAVGELTENIQGDD